MKHTYKVFIRKIKIFFRKHYLAIKFKYQRMNRGFSDADMFNADTFLTQQFAGMLTWYINNSNGVPMRYRHENDMHGEDIEYMIEQRNIDYGKYIALFSEYSKNGLATDDDWKAEFGGLDSNELHEALQWLVEHFTEFWD